MKTSVAIAWPIRLAFLLGLAASALIIAFIPTVVTADDNGDEETHQQEEAREESQRQTYNYVAQPGDSYTKMARKAVQTYGIVNEVNLSQAQIICAETNITIAANAPELAIGQEVDLLVDDIANWIGKAVDLDDEDEALWRRYVAGVDFNTDNVGEARE